MTSENNNVVSVASFLSLLEKNNVQSNINQKIYFRGKANEEWDDIPSLYRSQKSTKNEHIIFHQMVSQTPDTFKKCNSTFDHLVTMQHYGLPTRLLDITSDPLVALYFACCSEHEKTGKISIYTVPCEEVKTYESDTVSIIANLAKINELNLNLVYLFYHMLDHYCLSEEAENLLTDYFSKKYDTYTNDSIQMKNALNNYLSNESIKLKDMIENDTLDEYTMFESKNSLNLLKECQNILNPKQANIGIMISKEIKEAISYLEDYCIFSSTEIKKLLIPFTRFMHFIKFEKPYFDSKLINLNDISSVKFVEPKKDNPRIIKQNGAFLIFGLAKYADSKQQAAEIPNEYYFKVQEKKFEIIIPHDKKEPILEQLRTLSISESTLFPEPEKVAKDIKENYLK